MLDAGVASGCRAGESLRPGFAVIAECVYQVVTEKRDENKYVCGAQLHTKIDTVRVGVGPQACLNVYQFHHLYSSNRYQHIFKPNTKYRLSQKVLLVIFGSVLSRALSCRFTSAGWPEIRRFVTSVLEQEGNDTVRNDTSCGIIAHSSAVASVGPKILKNDMSS